MSLIIAKPRPYALMPLPYAPTWTLRGRPGQHPAELGLPVVEGRGHAVHRQGQGRPGRPGEVVGEHPRRLGLLLQPVVPQGVVHLPRPGERQQPHPASQAAEDTEVASSRPVPSALRRTGLAATVTTTANFSLGSSGDPDTNSLRTEGSSPCPVEPCSTEPSAEVPTCISQRGPVKASSRPYHGKGASR